MLGCFLLEAYFAVNYGLADNFLKNVKAYGTELNSSLIVPILLVYCNILVNKNLILFGRTLPSDNFLIKQLATVEISTMFDFAKNLQNVHNNNRVKIGSKYNSKYNMPMRENLCDSIRNIRHRLP